MARKRNTTSSSNKDKGKGKDENPNPSDEKANSQPKLYSDSTHSGTGDKAERKQRREEKGTLTTTVSRKSGWYHVSHVVLALLISCVAQREKRRKPKGGKVCPFLGNFAHHKHTHFLPLRVL